MMLRSARDFVRGGLLVQFYRELPEDFTFAHTKMDEKR